MKGIDALIKLHQFELDEKRRTLKELETTRASIATAIEMLEKDVLREQEAARSSESGYAYGAFADASIKRRERLEKALGDAATQVDTAREVVMEAFGEFKKYEFTKAARDEASRKEAARRDGIVQNELGAIAFERNRRR
ncbi:MAG: flagellar FliJ family protein [Alphaproteobacteria bacterium]|nr:flagellar FliJ family protein [Alphaproteobacteria bacterium]